MAERTMNGREWHPSEFCERFALRTAAHKGNCWVAIMLVSVLSVDDVRIEVLGESRAKTIPASKIIEVFDRCETGFARDMAFFVAELNGSRYWKTARGSASACWAALSGEQEADPLELLSRGWNVLRCVATAIESDLRYHA